MAVDDGFVLGFILILNPTAAEFRKERLGLFIEPQCLFRFT